MSNTKINIKKILFTLLWSATAVCGIVLLVAAVKSKSVKVCKGIRIDISGVSNNFFIDKKDVLNIIKNYVGVNPVGRAISEFNLRDIESNLETDVWVKNAELFFDNNELLRVSVDEREPVARVFSGDGQSFYIDESLMLLPLSDKFSARLPVFTGFPNARKLSKADSSLLSDIKKISILIQKDSFLMAMIDQVDITPQRNFEMIPKIGNQLIVFGQADEAEEKFNKLRLFYKTVMTKTNWNKYSVISLQYKNQVVAKIKDAVDKTSDSLRALQIMAIIAERSERMAEDSVHSLMPGKEKINSDSSMIQQSVQRDEPEEANSFTNEKPPPNEPTAAVIKMPAAKKVEPEKIIIPEKKPDPEKKPQPKKPAAKKATEKKPEKAPARIPKAVMNE